MVGWLKREEERYTMATRSSDLSRRGIRKEGHWVTLPSLAAGIHLTSSKAYPTSIILTGQHLKTPLSLVLLIHPFIPRYGFSFLWSPAGKFKPQGEKSIYSSLGLDPQLDLIIRSNSYSSHRKRSCVFIYISFGVEFILHLARVVCV